MTLQYKDYILTGTVDEIIEFIKANEPITFSNGSTMQYLGKTLSNALNSDLVYKVPDENFLKDEEPNTCEPNIEEEKKYRLFRSVVSVEDYEKHKDFYSQFICELDQNDPRFYILYLTEKENTKLWEQERKWLKK